MRRVVSLYLPYLPTDLRRKQAPTPETPMLTATRAGGKRLIAAVDAQAATLGLRPGMAVAQAQAMVPGLRIEEADPRGEQAALGRLAAWCLRHISPLAAPCKPDGIWIDITGGSAIFGGEHALLERLTARFETAGFATKTCVADTPGAAHAVARYTPTQMTIVPPGETQAALDPLPIAALRLPEHSVHALRTLGFDRIGQICHTPRGPLARRFGSDVLKRLDQATGALAEPIEPAALPDLPRSRQSFPEPIATPEDLARATNLLAHALCVKLERKGLGASRLDLVFDRIDGVQQALRIGTAAPTRDAAHLLRLLLPQLENIDPGFGVEHMSLTASLVDILGARQKISDLAEAGGAADLTCLVDMIANRLGPGAIFRVQPVESDVPERSRQRIPPLSKFSGANWPDRLPRPTRLFDPPYPVQAIALLPDHAPVQFTWRRRTHRVRRSDGPERIYGEWWRRAEEFSAVRDYFQVEDEVGQRFWLFRRGDGANAATGDQSWFLHGLFA